MLWPYYDVYHLSTCVVLVTSVLMSMYFAYIVALLGCLSFVDFV